MSNKTILDLNEDCFREILANLYLEDFGNFSQVCQRFRQVFVDSIQFKEFEIFGDNLKMFFITSENIEILKVDLLEILSILEEHSRADRQNMFRDFCKQFQNMKALKRLELNLDSNCYKILPDLNICDEMVKFLKDLPHLTELKIVCVDDDENDNYLRNLNACCELKLLTHFSAVESVDINLKELCKSNENLSYLVVEGYYEGNISDIVPFCRNLKTLDYYTFKNMDNCSALGELPQLQVLKIPKLTNDREFKQMCQKLASTNLLQELVLYCNDSLEESYIDLEETKEICKIKSLKRLECYFKDYECVQYVAQLTNLKVLSFDIRNNSVDFSDSLCHILRECKQMESMYIEAGGLPQNFVFQAFKVLEVVRNPVEQKPLQLRLPNWKYDLPSQDKELYKSYIDMKRYDIIS